MILAMLALFQRPKGPCSPRFRFADVLFRLEEATAGRLYLEPLNLEPLNKFLRLPRYLTRS
jgi:hypothetical protein